jgi:SAM-dependent methyltransferase
VPAEERYLDGSYASHIKDWHVSEAPWKALHALAMLRKHRLAPETVCEVGCGAGEALRLIQQGLPPACQLTGYDIAPYAIELARPRENERLRFVQGDITALAGQRFDLTLVLDVVEHVEDYFTLLRSLRPLGAHTLFMFPLDLSAQAVLRPDGLLYTRREYGHLHYFTKEVILALLAETGYDVVDWEYARESLEAPTHVLRRKLLWFPRRVVYALNQDIAAHLLGGSRLLVLAREAQSWP